MIRGWPLLFVYTKLKFSGTPFVASVLIILLFSSLPRILLHYEKFMPIIAMSLLCLSMGKKIDIQVQPLASKTDMFIRKIVPTL